MKIIENMQSFKCHAKDKDQGYQDMQACNFHQRKIKFKKEALKRSKRKARMIDSN